MTVTRITARIDSDTHVSALHLLADERFARDVRCVPVAEGHCVVMAWATVPDTDEALNAHWARRTFLADMSMTTHDEAA